MDAADDPVTVHVHILPPTSVSSYSPGVRQRYICWASCSARSIALPIATSAASCIPSASRRIFGWNVELSLNLLFAIRSPQQLDVQLQHVTVPAGRRCHPILVAVRVLDGIIQLER